jgi:phage shock protein PspC (stress-responsive transcriptional regulator)
MKIDWKAKLTSRKMWAAIAGFISGLAIIFGLDQGIIETVSGAVVAIGSVVVYIVSEGKVDCERIKAAAQKTQDAIDAIKKDEPK